MIRRFVRDESGITMAVTVFMVVLIGVMGAGLLTFVMSDTGSVLEVNRGQKAMDVAEAGVQAAKAHLRLDSFREHYDTDANGANDCASPSGIRVGKENWGKATYHWEPDPAAATSNPGECFTRTNNPTDVTSTPWPENYGVTRTVGGGRFHVTIECFKQAPYAGTGTPGTTDPSCVGGAGDAPVTTINPSETKFFKITSTGYDTASGDGAVRRIEAVYTTSKRTYAPIAFWTPRDMDFSGVDCVRKLSAFAGRNILGATKGSNGCGPVNPINSSKTVADRLPSTDTTRCPTGSPTPCPPDAIYGDWKQGPNPTGRTDASGTPITKVGFGALGRVCLNTCTSDSNSIADGYNDYDSTTGCPPTGTCPSPTSTIRKKYKFVTTVTDPTSQITFPFDTVGVFAPPASPSNPDPSKMIDPGLLEEMRYAADQQKNCYSIGTTCTRTTLSTLTIGTTGGGTRVAWPGPGAILFVDGANVDIAQDSEGMIIVRNGNVTIGGNITFKGIIIAVGNGDLSGGSCAPNSGTGYYTSSGNPTLDGYVAASGCIKVSGNITPNTTLNYTNLNSFYDTKLWSWREVYDKSF